MTAVLQQPRGGPSGQLSRPSLRRAPQEARHRNRRGRLDAGLGSRRSQETGRSLTMKWSMTSGTSAAGTTSSNHPEAVRQVTTRHRGR